MTSNLISDSYKAQQAHLHATTNYGVASIKYAPLVTEIINRLEITHLLDYGSGKMMNLGKQAYDPAVEELSGLPVPAEMVACVDVLEHIEPECLDAVLDHIASLTEAVVFLTVHTGPAGKTLPDGRNAHVIQQPMEWWIPKFTQRFELQTVQVRHHQAFFVIGHPKARIEAVDGSKIAA
jgi:hypothetical protein